MLYSLILAIIISQVQTAVQPYNQLPINSRLEGFVYNIADSKADFYVDGVKYKLKAKGLDDKLEGGRIAVDEAKYKWQSTLNQHSYNYQRHYQLLGYRGYLTGKVVGRAKGAPDRLIRRLIYIVKGYVGDFCMGLSVPAEVLSRALLLGEMSDQTLRDHIKSLGLIHLFVISGYHFAAISMIVFALLFYVLRLPYRTSMVIIVGVCTIYFSIIKSGYGSQRALLTLLVSFMCFLLAKRADGVQITLLYVATALAINNKVIFELGFQLTTITCISVVMINRFVKRFRLMSPTLQGLAISGGVYLTISAILIYAQGFAPVIGILLVPLLTPLIGSFILLAVLGVLLPPLLNAPFYHVIIDFFARQVIDLITWSANLDILTLAYSPLLAMSLTIIVLLCFGSHILVNRGWHIWRGFSLGCLIAGALLVSQTHGHLTINSYALYDGEAYLIRAPHAVLMYDVGNSPDIIHLLKREGVTTIDAIVISHAHRDHIGMLAEIVRQFDVKAVITSLDDGQHWQFGNVELQLFQPPAPLDNNLNNYSIACRLSYGGFDMLLTGDMEEAACRWLMATEQFDIDLLKVPHHGSGNAVFDEMLQHFKPEVAIIAGGLGKRIDKSSTYASLHGANTPFYDTIISGEVRITSDGRTYQMRALGEYHVIQGLSQRH